MFFLNLRNASIALATAGALSGCGTTYVNDSKLAKEKAPVSSLEQKVYFELNESLAGQPPTCIHVLPFEDPEKLDPEFLLRKAFHAQLSITGVRLIPLQAIEKRSAQYIAQKENCSYTLQATVTDNKSSFYGVFSEYRAGVRAELVHLPSGSVYWRGSHTLVKRDGGLPIGIISAISGAASAARNLDSDQATRVSRELAHRLVRSIPNLNYSEDEVKADPVTAGLQPPKLESGALPKTAQSPTHTPYPEVPSDVIARIDEQQKQGPITSEAFITRAKSYQALGQHEKATSDLISAIAMGDNTDKTYINLGRSYAALGRFDFAAVAFDVAVEKNQLNLEALTLGGIAHSANGDDELAYALLRQALVQSLAADDKRSAKRALSALRSTGLFEKLSEADQSFLQSEL